MNVAIIPARGGSKRIPRKNIKDFCGKPMIAWSIEAVKNSKLFSHIIVSTDDEEIAAVARNLGVGVPFVRPVELSGDFTGTTEVIAHAVKYLRGKDISPSAVCCIYATAPFLQVEDLVKGYEAFVSGGWEYAFAVTEYKSTIYRSFKETNSGGVEMIFPDLFGERSQDLPVALHDTGQFYWGTPDAWCNQTRIFGNKSLPIRIPSWRVQDIDTPQDWIRAELMFKSYFT